MKWSRRLGGICSCEQCRAIRGTTDAYPQLASANVTIRPVRPADLDPALALIGRAFGLVVKAPSRRLSYDARMLFVVVIAATATATARAII